MEKPFPFTWMRTGSQPASQPDRNSSYCHARLLTFAFFLCLLSRMCLKALAKDSRRTSHRAQV